MRPIGYLFNYLRKIITSPSHTVIKMGLRKIKAQIWDFREYKLILRKGTFLSDEEFCEALGISSKEKNKWIEKFKKKNIKERCLLYWASNTDKIKEAVLLISEEEKKKIIGFADKICKHRFDLLGSGEVKVSYNFKPKGFEGHCYNMQIDSENLKVKREKISRSATQFFNYNLIDWHIDFKSGYRWNEETWYKKIQYGHKPGADVIVPWELSRLQHLVMLGEAYWLTGDEKYSKEFVYQVIDWIKNNPPQFGVNWASTMDVAIRAANWLLGFSFFEDSKEITNEFLLSFLKSLLIHGRHIMENLAYGIITSNHYLSNIMGLVYLGTMFPEFREAKKWRDFGIKELIKEMKKQIYSDGCDFEASTCYHRLVLEFFFFVTLLVVVNDTEFDGENHREITEKIFGKEYTEKIYKMFEAVLYLLKPNGRMPQIGDNDNGMLHKLAKHDVLDMRYLLTFGAIFFKEPKFKVKEFGFSEEALWVFGVKGYEIWQGLEENCLANIGSKAFPDAGWYIMRNDKDYMIISCGPNGQNGNGGHCHNDKLSFELCIDGKDIIVDPGTYVYTADPKWRNKFRSTAYHNTVMIDEKEQNRFDEKNLFWMRNEAKVKVNKWETNEEYDFLDAQHSGYRRLIFFDKQRKYWIVKDIMKGKDFHWFDLYFHLSPIKVEFDEKFSLVARTNLEGANLAIIPVLTKNVLTSIEEGWVSCQYGIKVKAPIVRYSIKDYAPANFCNVIYPYRREIDIKEILDKVEDSRVQKLAFCDSAHLWKF